MVTTTNTHLIATEFELHEPATIDDALDTLARLGDSARLLAGGTDLLVQLKLGRVQPEHIVSLDRIAALSRIDINDGLTLGATTTVHATALHALVQTHYTALAEACEGFSTTQTMFMGTIGGNLCNASPAADTAPPLLVLDARLHLRASTGTRDLSLDEFFVRPGATALAVGELLESIHIPQPAEQSGSAFVKLGRVTADISKVSAAVSLQRAGGAVVSGRIALGAVAPTPRRAPRAEAILAGGDLTSDRIEQVITSVREEINPITDARSTSDYRRQISAVLVSDALRQAWQRSGGTEIK